jgi:hypothetical protein
VVIKSICRASTPNDFASLAEVEVRLRLDEELTNRPPRPFKWTFTRSDLVEWLRRLEAKRRAEATPLGDVGPAR